jgi:hypothetical protein
MVPIVTTEFKPVKFISNLPPPPPKKIMKIVLVEYTLKIKLGKIDNFHL